MKRQIWETKEAMERSETELHRLKQLNTQKRKWQPGPFSTRVLEEELKAKDSMLQYKAGFALSYLSLIRSWAVFSFVLSKSEWVADLYPK